MGEVRLQAPDILAIWIQCLPDHLQRGELLDGAGAPLRSQDIADLKAHFGADSPVVAQLERTLPPQEPRFVLIRLPSVGTIDLRVRSHDREPELNYVEWETIEQVGAEFNVLEPTAELHSATAVVDHPDLDHFMKTQVASGWNMIRAHRRARPHDPATEVLIDLWPIAGPADMEHLKHEPAAPELPKVRPGEDIYGQWVRITSCIIRGGAGSTADRPQGQPHAIAERVTNAIRADGIEPNGFPTVWFHILTLYPEDRWTHLIPNYTLLTLEKSLQTRRKLPNATDRANAHPTFVADCVPLAENEKSILVARIHSNEKHTQVDQLMKEDYKIHNSWVNLVHFLGDLAYALENRTPFLGYRPQFTQKELTWHVS